MNNQNFDFLSNTNLEINFQDFIFNLLIAGVLSFIIKLFYKKFSTTLSNREEFSKNFVLLSVTTFIVITVVKNSLALSLGLVGALSIVRFRAAIKEPEELVYLFLIISIGLGCGAGQIKVTVAGIFFSTIIIYLNSIIRTKEITKSGVLNLGIITQKKLNEGQINLIIELVRKEVKNLKFVSLASEEKTTTINLNLIADDSKQLSKITSKINKQFSNTKIIITQNDDLAI